MLSRIELMVVHLTKSLNLVDRNPGTWAKTEGYTFFGNYTKNKELYAFHSDGQSVLKNLASVFTLFNFTLCQSPLFSAILVFFLSYWNFFQCLTTSANKYLFLKKTIPFGAEETSNYMTLLLNNSSWRETIWL